MRPLPTALCFTLVASTAFAQSPPDRVAESFLHWHARNQPSGAPNKKELAELQEFLTDELVCLLRTSADFKHRFEKIAPDEKPPFVEGDLFLGSMWERPTKFDIELVRTQATTATVLVHFFYNEEFSWRDRFNLRLERGQWRVFDIDQAVSSDRDKPGSILRTFYAAMDLNISSIRWKRSNVQRCKSQT